MRPAVESGVQNPRSTLTTVTSFAFTLVVGSALLFSTSPANAANLACRDLFVSTPMHIEKIEQPQELLTELYTGSNILAFGNADHESPKTFLELEKFLRAHAQDARLKSVAIEISSELAPFFEAASTRDLNSSDWQEIGAWKWFLETQSEPSHIMNVLVPLVRKLNLQRSGDPLVLVPIDGIDAKTLMSNVRSFDSVVDFDVPISPTSMLDWMFLQSIDREIKTAANYEKLIARRWPTRKGLVIYHQAHVLRNLEAWGVTRTQTSVRAVNAPLAWVDYVATADSKFATNLRVVLFDTISKSNPSGVIRGLPASRVAYAFRAINNPTFNNDSFLATYRTRSVRVSDSQKQIADGVVRLP